MSEQLSLCVYCCLLLNLYIIIVWWMHGWYFKLLNSDYFMDHRVNGF